MLLYTHRILISLSLYGDASTATIVSRERSFSSSFLERRGLLLDPSSLERFLSSPVALFLASDDGTDLPKKILKERVFIRQAVGQGRLFGLPMSSPTRRARDKKSCFSRPCKLKGIC